MQILILRNIGGMGDAVSAIPSILLFIMLNNEHDVTVAFPKFCHPLFANLIDVIDSKGIDTDEYDKVYQLDNPCPCAIYESQYREATRHSRIEIFGDALGIEEDLLAKLEPVYSFSTGELEEIENYKINHKVEGKVIGIGLHSAEGYRDYPGMPGVINALIERDDIGEVVLFGTKVPDNVDIGHPKITPLIGLNLRKVTKILSLCDSFITVDSLFLHLAAALKIETVLLDGPLESKYRFKRYPIAYRINTKKQFPECMPCWRNGYTPCIYSPLDLEKSLCMSKIEVGEINDCIS